jgi:glycosyltransferase involved in cell wall biosynthesis
LKIDISFSSPKVKVLVIHTAYKQRGGEDSVVFNEIQLLKNAGVEVSLLEFNNDKNTLLNVLQIPFNLASYNKTNTRIKEFKPDVIHIHNLHFAGSPAVIYAARARKIPVVLTLHNYRLLCPSATLFYRGELFTDSLNQEFPSSAAVKGVYRNSILLTFWLSASMWLHQILGTWKLVNKYIALTPHTKQLFLNSKLDYLGHKIIIKPNFCFPPKSVGNSTGNYFIYVGRLSEEKGIDVLLSAFKKNNLLLKIVGSGPLEADVIKAAVESKNIEFLGSLPPAEVALLLSNAKALIFTSQWYETFGMVIIEAFSAGVPVIASNIGHLQMTVKNGINGLLFTTGDTGSLNQKLEYFEALPLTSKLAYRKNALETYRKLYTPEINLAAMLNLYSGVIMKKEI